MSFTRTYYPEFNFLLTRCAGIIDDQAMLIHLLSLNNESKGLSSLKELVDVRGLRNSTKVTANGLIHSANVFRDLFSRMNISSAVLVGSSAAIKPTEIYLQLFASPSMTIKVFEKEVDAPLGWLGYDKDDCAAIKQFIARHAVPD